MDIAALDTQDEPSLQACAAELVVGAHRLLIEHDDICSIEPIEAVRMHAGHGQAIGTLQLGDDEWAVFSLGENLEVLDTVPETRRACVALRAVGDASQGGVAILCDEARMIDDASPTLVPVPGCMRDPQGPLQTLAIVDDRVSCVLSAERLSATLLDDAGSAGDS